MNKLLTTVAASIMCLSALPVQAQSTSPDVSDKFMAECLISQRNGYESWLYENNVLCINGAITSGTLYGFETDMMPRQVDLVILNSGGGTKAGGEAVAEYIQEHNIDVYVPAGARCMSNCLLLLHAGDNQTVEENTRIAPHFVYVLGGEDSITVDFELSDWYFENIGNSELYQDYKEYVVELGILSIEDMSDNTSIDVPKFLKLNGNDRTYWPAASFMYLTPEQLVQYGVINP